MLLCCLTVQAQQSFLAYSRQVAALVEKVTQLSTGPNVHPGAWTATEKTALVWQMHGVYESGPQPDPDSSEGVQWHYGLKLMGSLRSFYIRC